MNARFHPWGFSSWAPSPLATGTSRTFFNNSGGERISRPKDHLTLEKGRVWTCIAWVGNLKTASFEGSGYLGREKKTPILAIIVAFNLQNLPNKKNRQLSSQQILEKHISDSRGFKRNLAHGFNTLETYWLVKLESFPQIGVKIKQQIELPPPRKSLNQKTTKRLSTMWLFPKIVGKPPKWIVKIMEKPIKKWMI